MAFNLLLNASGNGCLRLFNVCVNRIVVTHGGQDCADFLYFFRFCGNYEVYNSSARLSNSS